MTLRVTTTGIAALWEEPTPDRVDAPFHLYNAQKGRSTRPRPQWVSVVSGR